MQRTSRTNPDFTSSLSDLTQATHTTTSSLMAKLQEKHAEYEHLCQIRDMSAQLVVYFEELTRSTDTLVNGVQSVSNVLTNWNNVFRVMSMTGSSVSNDLLTGDQDSKNAQESLPTVLVKIPTGGDN